jgi:tungstate transport system ATP-binding protein
MQSLFSIEKLRISHQKRLILNIPQFSIPATGCIWLQGKNGSGKTTLLKILAGLIQAQSFDLILPNQKKITAHQAKFWLRKNVVYLHQQPYLFDTTVFNNVAYGLRCQGKNNSEIKQLVTQSLAWANLSHLSQRHARQLSGGEQQRIALIRAWLLSPRLLLLDEPTANMDKDAYTQTQTLLANLQQDNLTIILTSHQLNMHPTIGQLLWQLKDGQLFFQ